MLYNIKYEPVEMGVGTSLIATQGLEVLKTNVNGSITTLANYQSFPVARDLTRRYNELLTLINATRRDISGANTDIIISKQSVLNAKNDALDQEKALFLYQTKGITTVEFLQVVSYYLGMLFAVIIITNKMVSEPWYYKIYYAVFGMMFYPLVLIWGVFNPPQWRAVLIPFVDVGKKEWYIRYLGMFTYGIPTGELKPDTSSMALRIFTIIVLLFWGILQGIDPT